MGGAPCGGPLHFRLAALFCAFPAAWTGSAALEWLFAWKATLYVILCTRVGQPKVMQPCMHEPVVLSCSELRTCWMEYYLLRDSDLLSSLLGTPAGFS